MNYSAAIIDDEKDAIELLEEYIASFFPEIRLIGKAQYADELTTIFKQNPPDILLLDVKLIGMTGFDILERMNFPATVQTIFVTAHEEYAVKAFDKNAAGYLVKPVAPKAFRQIIKKTLEKIDAFRALKETRNELVEKYAIPSKKDFQLTEVNQIVFCQASGAYTFFFLTSGKKVVASKPLGEIERNLSAKGFIRVHQSYLVNCHHILEFNHAKSSLMLTNGGEIVVSRRQKKTVKTLLKDGIIGE